MRFKDRVAFITGASRGVGKNIALALAREGCDVVAAAKTVEADARLPGTIGETVAEVEKLGRRGLALPLDVRDDAGVERATKQALDKMGRIDFLINNAGALHWRSLLETPLKASARIPAARAARAIETLEMAAFAADVENFTLELGEALILPWRIAAQLVNDPGGEPLACAAKALDMPSPVFQRVLLFLKPEVGSSVTQVYRLSRLYDHLHERSALIMLAAWRGATMAVARAKYRPALYDDDRQRARSAPAQTRPAAVQPPGAGGIVRTRSQGSGS